MMHTNARHCEFSKGQDQKMVLETTKERKTGIYTKDQNQNDILFLNQSTGS